MTVATDFGNEFQHFVPFSAPINIQKLKHRPKSFIHTNVTLEGTWSNLTRSKKKKVPWKEEYKALQFVHCDLNDDVTECWITHTDCVNRRLVYQSGGTPPPVQVKIIPITGPRCPEGSRKLRFLDYVTMAQDGGKVVSLTHRPLLPPWNTPGTYFC